MRAESHIAVGTSASPFPRSNAERSGGENVPDYQRQSGAQEDAEREVLGAIFRDTAAAQLFVVLRNGAELPHRRSGNDIDVSVQPRISTEAVVAFITGRAREVGWAPLCISVRRRVTGFSIVDARSNSTGAAIHFDVFDGISAFGISLITTTLLAEESVVRRNVRLLNARGRALATIAHHVGCSGALTKDAYISELAPVLACLADRVWLIDNVRRAAGSRVAGELQVGVAAHIPHPLRKKSRVRQLAALWAAARHTPDGMAAVFRGVSSYVTGQLPSLIQPSGLIGCLGDRIPDVPALLLTGTLACRVAPLAMIADDVRSPANTVRTENSDKHQRCSYEIWSASVVLRWTLPSLFLAWQAKRGRVVVLRRLPFGLRLIRRLTSPRWLTVAER